MIYNAEFEIAEDERRLRQQRWMEKKCENGTYLPLRSDPGKCDLKIFLFFPTFIRLPATICIH